MSNIYENPQKSGMGAHKGRPYGIDGDGMWIRLDMTMNVSHGMVGKTALDRSNRTRACHGEGFGVELEMRKSGYAHRLLADFKADIERLEGK